MSTDAAAEMHPLDDPDGEATDAELEELEADMDRIVAGELPLGALFGMDRDDIQALADMADELLTAGRVAEARDIYEACVRLDPMDVVLVIGLATTVRHTGDAERAKELAGVALELAPDSADVRDYLRDTGLLA